MRKEYKVYVLKCNKTDKVVYVGLTRQPLKFRYDGHVLRFKFNRSDYRIELVVDELELLQAVELEKMLIKQYNTLVEGWNKSPGSINGSSNYHSEEQKKKWSTERKGKPVNPDHAAKNRVARKGKQNSPDHQRRILEVLQKPVMCLESGVIYPSIRQAAKALNLCYSKVGAVCRGERRTTGNLHFVFVGNSRD